jgi:hypothetical protein
MFTIDVSFVNGYKTNILMLSQQKNARLFGKSRVEVQNSESDFYERIGSVDAQDVVGRHGDTPNMEVPHSRRRVSLEDAEFGTMLDNFDKIRLLIDPQNSYVQAAVMSLSRKKDAIFIAAALGNAYSGKTGSTAVALPTSQKLAAFDGATTTGVNINVETLVAIKGKFWSNEAIMEGEGLYLALASSQFQALLNNTKVTNVDYASVKALVNGEVNTFMGFTFIHSELLPRSAANVTYTVTDGTVGAGTGTITAAKSRRCIAWAAEGMISVSGIGGYDLKVNIGPDAAKKFHPRIYACHSVGATRLEEVKVVEVICSE